MQLKDLKVIVTGAARGMGAHFAQRLAEAGAQVAAGDVDEAALDALPPKVHKRKLDVRREGEVVEFVAWARDAMGGLNGLVNNAGIIRDGMLVKKDRATGEIKKMTAEDWRAVLDVNLTGATFMVREVVALMLATRDAPGRRRQHVEHLAARQQGAVELRGDEGRPRGEHAHLGARVRPPRHPRRGRRAWHDRDADDAGDAPEGARRARGGHPGRAHRRARRTSGWR